MINHGYLAVGIIYLIIAVVYVVYTVLFLGNIRMKNMMNLYSLAKFDTVYLVFYI